MLSDEFKAILEMMRHVTRVQKNLLTISQQLQQRALVHDQSKYTFEEFEGFVDLKIVARTYPLDSPEYKESMKGDVIKLHFAANSHHPEHYKYGIESMSLLDIIEMVCDWWAVNKMRQEEGRADLSWEDSLEYHTKRFNLQEHHIYLINLIVESLDGSH